MLSATKAAAGCLVALALLSAAAAAAARLPLSEAPAASQSAAQKPADSPAAAAPAPAAEQLNLPEGIDSEALVQQLTERGPCSQVVACFVAPCSLPGACPERQVCLNDYCGGCNTVCAGRAEVCLAVLRIQPGAACS
jgi:hypothetical protein